MYDDFFFCTGCKNAEKMWYDTWWGYKTNISIYNDAFVMLEQQFNLQVFIKEGW